MQMKLERRMSPFLHVRRQAAKQAGEAGDNVEAADQHGNLPWAQVEVERHEPLRGRHYTDVVAGIERHACDDADCDHDDRLDTLL